MPRRRYITVRCGQCDQLHRAQATGQQRATAVGQLKLYSSVCPITDRIELYTEDEAVEVP